MPAEWEVRLTKLEEATVVNASLMNKLEQNADRVWQSIERLEQRAEAHEEGIAELRAAQVALIATAERHEDGFARLRASQEALFERMDGLFERFDRFLRGQEGNGRKQ